MNEKISNEQLTQKQKWTNGLLAVLVLALSILLFNELWETYSYRLKEGIAFPKNILLFLPVYIFSMAFFLFVWIKQKSVFSLLPVIKKPGAVRWVLAVLLGAASAWFLVFSKFSSMYAGFYIRTSLVLIVLLWSAWLINRNNARAFSLQSLLAALIITGFLFTVTQELSMVSDYPFTQYWSEGNRFYDYSTIYGREIYNYPAGQALTAYSDAARVSLWGLPFLFGTPSIWFMRLWDMIVFTIPYILLGLFALRLHLDRSSRFGIWVLFALWSYLFLMQGPVYSPLVLAALLVVSIRRVPIWAGVVLVFLAGYYAHFARYTWMFAPAIWAMLICFLGKEKLKEGAGKIDWITMLGYGAAGLAGGVGLDLLLNALNPSTMPTQELNLAEGGSGVFDLLFRQPLLWERLFPNPVYAPGILLGVLLAAGALILLLGIYFYKKFNLNIWQRLLIGGTFLAFLVVGMTISIKIGGGNLHNMDMFLIFLLILAVFFIEEKLVKWLDGTESLSRGLQLLVWLAVLIPSMRSVYEPVFYTRADPETTQAAMNSVHEWIERAGNGEILFFDHRQLLTFGYVEQVPLVAEYEKKEVMDRAMADEADYFAGFYQDLAEHRFSLIISEPLEYHILSGDNVFSAENNRWVKWVSLPILCYYQPVEIIREARLEILIPKSVSSPENSGFECPIQ